MGRAGRAHAAGNNFLWRHQRGKEAEPWTPQANKTSICVGLGMACRRGQDIGGREGPVQPTVRDEGD